MGVPIKKNFMKIKIKILLSFLIVILISISVSILTIKEIAKNTIEDTSIEDNLQTGNLILEMFNQNNYGDWRIVNKGYLYKGNVVINDNLEILQSITGNMKSKEYAFICNNKIVLTSIKDNRNRYITDELKEDVIQVLQSGKQYKGIVSYNNKDYLSAYIPIKTRGGEVIGAFFVGTDNSNIKDIMYNIDLISLVISIIAVILSFIISLLIANDFIKVTYKANKELITIAKADLTGKIDFKNLNRKDEFGNIFKNIDNMKVSISNIIKNVKKETLEIDNRIEKASESISTLLENVEDVSATTQQLSASMQQTSASSDMIKEVSKKIQNEVKNISNKAKESAYQTKLIIEKSDKIKKDAIISKTDAESLYLSVQNKLKNAIEKTNTVKEIAVLSEIILNISSKTNLLALNATIEAAKAGESGKGFAVIASEIRKMADESKITVSKIQNITKVVIASVNNLIENANEVLEFINTKVVNDYNVFLTISEQYSIDSNNINLIMSDFEKISNDLFKEIKGIVKSIEEISIANNESAIATETIAEKAQDINEKTKEIFNQHEMIKNNVYKLIEKVKIFNVED